MEYGDNKSLDYMLQRSGLPKAKWKDIPLKCEKVDLEAFEDLQYIKDNIQEQFFTYHYSDDNKYRFIDDNNLLICGDSLGCGKTTWSIKIFKQFLEEQIPRFEGVDAKSLDKTFNIGIFVPTTKFLVDMKQFGSNKQAQELYERLQTAEMVVWDDLAAVNMSKYDYNILYALIDYRILSEKANIFTTNAISEEALGKETGERLAQRIWRTSTIIELKGEGKRGRIL